MNPIKRVQSISSNQSAFQRRVSIFAAIAGATAVALGAFGAHTLKGLLDERSFETFDTAVRYHLIHSVVLLVIGWTIAAPLSRWTRRAALLIAAGVVLFSGSLYGLVLTKAAFLGPVTPIGGVCLIGGWVCLAIAATRQTAPGGNGEDPASGGDEV